MYLLAWSPALWPRTPDGSGVALPPPEARLPVKEGIEVLEWVAWFLPQSRVGLRVTQAERAFTAAKQLDEFEENIPDIWEESVGQAEHFGATVPYVRRVWANVATYTMFDDHEVTDNWYVDRDVADRLLGMPRGASAMWVWRRVVRRSARPPSWIRPAKNASSAVLMPTSGGWAPLQERPRHRGDPPARLALQRVPRR